MSVFVGGRTEESTRPTRSRWPVAVLVILCGGLLIVTGPSPSTVPQPDPQIQPPVSTPGLPEGWARVGEITARYLLPGRAGDSFLIQVEGQLALLDAEARLTSPDLPGLNQYRGVVTRGDTVVAFGRAESGPALWTPTADVAMWRQVPLPWDGSVQAVTLSETAVTVLGTAGDGWVTARQSLPLEADSLAWSVSSIEPPGTVVIPVQDGFVARSLTEDEYLHSVDGREWTSYAEVIIHPVGEVAALVQGPTGLSLQLAGDDRTVVPPEWPVSALWRVGDRIWIQTPTAAWWSSDGRRWYEAGFDEDEGFPGGRPVLLPFSDRALIAVGPTDLARRDLFTWYVGD